MNHPLIPLAKRYAHWLNIHAEEWNQSTYDKFLDLTPEEERQDFPMCVDSLRSHVMPAILVTYHKENVVARMLVVVMADHDFTKGPYQDTVPFAVGSNQMILDITSPAGIKQMRLRMMEEGELPPGTRVIADGERAKVVEWNFRTDSDGSKWAYLDDGTTEQFACPHSKIQPDPDVVRFRASKSFLEDRGAPLKPTILEGRIVGRNGDKLQVITDFEGTDYVCWIMKHQLEEHNEPT